MVCSGERLNGIQEVSGSIPLISTTEKPWDCRSSGAFPFSRCLSHRLFSNAFLTPGGQVSGELGRHALLSGYIQMAVDIGGHLNVGMAHPLLHVLEGKACVDEQAGAAMPLWHNKDKSENP